MNCSDLETLLCDYVDGTLAPLEKAEVERHLAACTACAETARDAAAAVAFMEKAAEIEPPPELITQILFELPGTRSRPARERSGLGAALARLLRPVFQPRFAMGMAMTILSFSMIGRFAGIDVRQLSVSDLDPVRVWQSFDNRIERGWQRAVKFYESLRLFYELRARFSDLTAEEEEAGTAGASDSPSGKQQPRGAAGAATPDKRP